MSDQNDMNDFLSSIGTDGDNPKDETPKDETPKEDAEKEKTPEDDSEKEKTPEDESEKEDSEKEKTPEDDSDKEDSEKDDSEEEDTQAKDLSVEEMKLILNKGEPLPEGVDETRAELARAQIKIEVQEKENTSLKSSIQKNPSQLLTEEQKAEIEELATTKGFEAAYELRRKYEEEAAEKALNDPKVVEEQTRLQRTEDLRTFLKEKGVSYDAFRGAVLDTTKEQLKNGDISFQQFLEKTYETLKRISPKNIHKGDTPPAIKKAGRSTSAKKADAQSNADIFDEMSGRA